MRLYKMIVIIFLGLSLAGCITPPKVDSSQRIMSPKEGALLEQGKRFFVEGYYRKAMHILFPLACKGNSEAQYAVGYMYYYGYGVTQDTEVGYFWIQRSATQNYPPATRALQMMKV